MQYCYALGCIIGMIYVMGILYIIGMLFLPKISKYNFLILATTIEMSHI